MVIDKQAYFTAKFAMNVIKLPPAERQQALKQMPLRGISLIKAALEMIEAQKKNNGGLR